MSWLRGFSALAFSLTAFCLTAKVAHAATIAERTLIFSDQYSVGMVYIARDDERQEGGFAVHRTFLKEISPARGKVKVKLLPHEQLLLELNAKFMQHPDSIKSLAPDCVDIARLQYRAMEDSEATQFAKAIVTLARLKALKELEFQKCDVTDADLLSLRDLPELERLSADASFISGATLSKLNNWKNIREIYLQGDQIKAEYLPAFAGFPKLQALNLSTANLTGPLSGLSACSNLKYLRLNYNHKLGDNCIPNLIKLTKLKVLEVKGTAITAAGLERLKGLPFESLKVSDEMVRAADLIKLRTVFGKSLGIAPGKRETTEFDKALFAPTNRP